MTRGELYRVVRPSSRDPRRFRVFVVVSRQVLIDSKFSTVIGASAGNSSATRVPLFVSKVTCLDIVTVLGLGKPRKLKA